MLLKIKVDQVIQENGYPITAEHSNLDAIAEKKWDILITMADITSDVEGKVNYCIPITNIMDKEEIKRGLEGFLKTKEK